MLNALKRAVHLYDPGYFSLIYALKATLTTFVCATLGALFFSPSIMIWAGFQSIFIYFLSVLISDKDHEIYYLLGFVGLSCVIIVLVYPVAHFGVWLCVPLCLITFSVGLSMAYSMDLHKVCNTALSNGLITCLYVDAHAPIDFKQSLGMVSLLGAVSIVLQYFIFVSKYSAFTKKRFGILLSNMELMLQYANRPRDYAMIQTQVLQQIQNTKIILSSKSSKIKDPHTVQNLQRSLFQLHALEEIYHSIHSIYGYFNTQTLELVRQELLLNLKILAGMFTEQNTPLRTDALQHLDPHVDKLVRHSIEIIYNKMEVFLIGGEGMPLSSPTSTPPSFKNILEALHFKHPVFQYAFKYATAMGISVFTARYFGFNHGMWIAMATLLVSRSSIGSTKETQLEFVKGSAIGLLPGLLVVWLFADTWFFYVCLVLGVFLFIYLKVYSYTTWAAALMFAFLLCFSLFARDFVDIVASRVIDIALGITIVYSVFLFLWPKYDKDAFIQHTKSVLSTLKNLLSLTLKPHNLHALETQTTFLSQLNDFRLCLKNARSETSDTKSIQSLFRALKCLDVLDTLTYRLYEYCHNTPLSAETQLLVHNNTRLILSRYTQILNYLHNKPHYFKPQQAGRLLSISHDLDTLFDTLFLTQNKLFKEVTFVFKY
ncbi:FUSC family protein [Helicobacter baculiformis]|uniref:FUSC family protein n=1 Tax=Helicobacter baculiformis TaxID=427351 RepID=A0ABV7ZIH7_9HELI|nr:FUSC family protein [Helicobacter baculiformis]